MDTNIATQRKTLYDMLYDLLPIPPREVIVIIVDYDCFEVNINNA